VGWGSFRERGNTLSSLVVVVPDAGSKVDKEGNKETEKRKKK
jgi:hypothetical protein